MEIEVPGPAEVLLVADDGALSSEMAAYLAAHGYAVHQAADLAGALRILAEQRIAVVVLDTGAEAGALLRAFGADGPPVLVLSALGAEPIPAGVRRQEAAKPIRADELLARVRALTQQG